MTVKNRVCVVILLLSLVSMCGSTVADGFYAGAGVGYVEHEFKLQYQFTDGRSPRHFVDPADGMQGDLRGGYQFNILPKLSLGLQGSISANNAEWTLRTDEPANLVFDLPWAYTCSLVPEFRLSKRLGIFGEMGVGQGYARHQKSAPTASRYDHNEWLTAFSWALGVRFNVTDQWQVFAEYRSTSYEKTTFQSHLPDGTHWETIDSDIESEFYGIGVVYRASKP